MDVLYVNMESGNQRVPLPTTLHVCGKGCALFEISGRCYPYTDIPLFLCVDFIQDSSLGTKMIPILRRIELKPDPESHEGKISQVFNKMLWLPINRSPLDEVRVYITDDHGNVRSFDYCNIQCTLVCIPNVC